MATKIVTKNSSTAGAAPTATDLAQGELAVNVADKRLFTENNAGAIVELGTNPSTLTVTGEITANGGIALGDNDKATFGAGDDLEIYHDGTRSLIRDSGTGNLLIRATDLSLQNADGATYASFTSGGAGIFNHNNSTKLATTATGIDVTGTATMDGLVVEPSSATGLTYAADGTNSYINFEANSISDSVQLYAGQSSGGFFSIGTKNSGGTLAEAMRIDSSGRVSVGTKAWITADANVGYFGGNDTQSNHISFYDSLNLCRIYTDGNERMRIDASGNLLVGTTNTLPAIGNVEGISLSAGSFGGRFEASRDGAEAVAINRMTNDGSLMSFKKDGSTVGTIGTKAGDLTIGDADVGLRFDTGAGLIPWNMTTNAATDATMDIGAASVRFKDAYLSGGVYLGGTGAANKLSDFETGTWTPLLSDGTNTNATYSVQVGTYTKIGNSVHVQGRLTTTALGSVSGDIQIAGLPFNSANVSNAYSTASFGYAGGLNISAGVAVTGTIQANIPRIAMRTWDAATGTTNMTQAEWSANGDIIFSAEYTAA